MKYFKPAAGLLILIFMLGVAFVLFLDYRENSKEVERKAELDSCIETADYVRDIDHQMVQRYIASHIEVGDFDTMMAGCLQTPSFPSKTESQCRSAVIQSIKKNFNVDDESVESKYQTSVSNCRARYGN